MEMRGFGFSNIMNRLVKVVNLNLRVLFARLTIFAVALFVCSCATVYNPVTGQEERSLYSIEQEVELGKQAAQQIEKKQQAFEDERVSSIGLGIAESSDRPDLPYCFKVIESPEINAFALPGGRIYIYEGLLDILDDDELAAVLGHEVGHVAARHGIKRIQALYGYNFAAIVAMLVLGDQAHAAEISRAADTIATLIMLGYSRKDEFQADRLGTIYTYRSGRDPEAMIRVLRKLQEHSQGENIKFLSTHPPIEERIREAKIVISAFDEEKAL